MLRRRALRFLRCHRSRLSTDGHPEVHNTPDTLIHTFRSLEGYEYEELCLRSQEDLQAEYAGGGMGAARRIRFEMGEEVSCYGEELEGQLE